MKSRKRKQANMYLSLGAVAEMLGFTTKTIYKWALTGFLPGYRYSTGKRATWRFARSDVLRLLAEAYRQGKPESGPSSQ